MTCYWMGLTKSSRYLYGQHQHHPQMLKESGQIPGQISVAVGLLARLEVSGHLEIVSADKLSGASCMTYECRGLGKTIRQYF